MEPKASEPALAKREKFAMWAKLSVDELAGVNPKLSRRFAERLLTIAWTEAQKNPTIWKKCSPASVREAIINAARLGLPPGGPLQLAALVPYKGECQFQPMYRGLIRLAIQGGCVRNIEAEVIHENDLFIYEKGTSAQLRYTPHEFRHDNGKHKGTNAGEVIGAYAQAWLVNGGTQVEAIPRADLDKIQKASKAESGPWQYWPDEMRKKSAIKRLFKKLPMSEELATAIELDNHYVGAVDADYSVRNGNGKEILASGRHEFKEPIQEEPTDAEPEQSHIDGPPDPQPGNSLFK